MTRDFNPNAAPASDAGIFGLPFQAEESQIHLLPVPWDLTTSYRAGTASGPEQVLNASHQIDLFDLELGKAFEKGYFLHSIPKDLFQLNQGLRPKADQLRDLDDSQSGQRETILREINSACDKMNEWVYAESKKILSQGKILGLLGGDHSIPYSGIRAVCEKFESQVGILHLDAHADLRKSYEGMVFSHASIMHNVMRAPWKPMKLVQVGIRDFCEEEYDFIQNSQGQIVTFFDQQLKNDLGQGISWSTQCSNIVEQLPQNVYLSFDIDGLDPKLCPNTGTPVPGGLEFFQATELVRTVVTSGRKIVGFDLNEVSCGDIESNEWDANVAARLLYKMCGWTLVSQGLCEAR